MDFIDQIRALGAKAAKQKDSVSTEEATKNAFVMPFINALGYNVFDPSEVVPEFTADVGTKKGEKVDYAIFIPGNPDPVMLFECKKAAVTLDDAEHSQLYRYFSVTQSRIGVLTNGLVYRFYTDLEEQNKLDERPFLEIDLLNIQEPLVAELKKLTKSSFDLEQILDAAEDLKYSKGIKRLLEKQLTDPSEEFVRFFAAEVHQGKRLTQNVMDTFRKLVLRALKEFISEQINNRLKSALDQSARTPVEPEDDEETGEDSEVETTEEEYEAHRIIKSILRKTVDPSRVTMRDAKSYCSILLDDNNRRSICRLRFNNPGRLRLGLFDEDKDEEKVDLETLDDIFEHADRLIATVIRHEERNKAKDSGRLLKSQEGSSPD